MRAFARRHAVFLVVLGVAVGLRLVVARIYPYAFFFPDSQTYATGALHGEPNPTRPFGYSAFLMPFLHGPMKVVAVVQHAMALALITAGYAVLTRRGIRPWLAALAVTPITLSGRELTLEHLVLAETLFVVLAGGGLLVLTSRRRDSPLIAAVAGLLIAGAALTRSIGLPLIALCLLYLLVRRSGWRVLGSFTLVVTLALGGYLGWYHQHRGVYAFGEGQGRFLYGRVMTFADCDRLQLTDRERLLCDYRPVSERPTRTDWYVWDKDSPASIHAHEMTDDPLLDSFAKKAIAQQPGAYLGVVLRESYWHLMPVPPATASYNCGMYDLPERPGVPCRAKNYYAVASPDQTPRGGTLWPTPMRKGLHEYSLITSMIAGPLSGALLLITLLTACWRPRRGWRQLADALLFAGFGAGLIVGSVATSMFEPRYAVPALFFLPIGAALAVHRLITWPRRTAAPPPVRRPPTTRPPTTPPRRTRRRRGPP
ncbi:MAG TPA: hypothetical protein VF755_30410 [Catenuloplanes sp.]